MNRTPDRRICPLVLSLVVLLTPLVAAAQDERQLIVPDTPTVLGTQLVVEGEIAVYDPTTETYTLDDTLVIPGKPKVDAVHKLPNPGEYLFSTENGLAFSGGDPDPLAVVLGVSVQFNDVIRFDGEAGYSRFFCNLELPSTDMLPPGSNLDAMYLDGQDLVISIDAAATLGGVTYEQNDLLRYNRTGPGCGDWDFQGYEFDAGTLDMTGHPLIPSNYNVVGLSRDDTQIFFALDTPSDLGASAYNPYRPNFGELATWDTTTSTFTLNASFAGFPVPSSAYANSVASPPPSCTGLGDADLNDSIVDLCGAGWETDSGARRFRIEWLPLGGTLQYTVYRGLRSDLCPAGLAMTIVAQTSNNFYVELTDPPSGEVYNYLIAGDGGDLQCGNAPGCGGGCCPRVLIPPGTCP